ncbi:MAG: DNA polymerase III subunit delta' [Desulfuromonadaceae bacterium]|nr:DNA polymerase III subunit delta' [Desulfuromonadaceae bacterium]
MTFTAIIGHERQKKLLQHAWQSRRLAHAYLFSGTEGIGKRLMAMALVRMIFCQQQTGCGSCVACRRIDSNNHPDLLFLEPDGNQIKIDQVRAIQKELTFRPLEAAYRIILVDQAEKMNVAAANALLKTLEEPPDNTLLLLISAHPEQLLETIRSRCQHIPFSRLHPKEIKRVLVEQVDSNQDSEVLTTMAQGSLKKALGSDRDFYIVRRRELFRQVSHLTPAAILPLFKLAEELSSDKDQLEEQVGLLISCYRDVFLLSAKGSESLVANVDLLPQLQTLAGKLSPEQATAKLNALLDCQYHLKRNVNRQLAMENLLIRLVHHGPLPISTTSLL